MQITIINIMIHTYRFRKVRSILPFALLLAGVSACTETVSFDVQNEAPKSGTTILVVDYHYDSAGRALRTLDTSTIYVGAPLTAGGKSNVVPFYWNKDTTGTTVGRFEISDTLFVHYEPNGDLTLFEDGFTSPRPGLGGAFSIPDHWITYPFGSKTAKVQTLLDTSYTFTQGTTQVPVNVKAVVTTQFLGPEAVPTLSQGPLVAVKVEAKHERTVTIGVTRTQEVQAYILWYSPKLGAFVQGDGLFMTDNGSGNGLQQREHTGWTIYSHKLVK